MKRMRFAAAFAVLLFMAYTLFPFYWAVVSSFRKGSELYSAELLPKSMDLSNYALIFRERGFGIPLVNSVVVATTTVALSTLLALTAAYALARREFTGRRLILASFLVVSMFPQIAVLSGMFELIRALGLFNARMGLALAYLIFTLPFTVWTLCSFMRQIPRELEEAAIMDGAGSLRIIFGVFVPILAPSLVTTALLGFIAAWNELMFAMTFTLSGTKRTVPVAIAGLSGASEHEIPWGAIMAASVTVTIPIIVLVLVFQRRIVSGLTSGALKG